MNFDCNSGDANYYFFGLADCISFGGKSKEQIPLALILEKVRHSSDTSTVGIEIATAVYCPLRTPLSFFSHSNSLASYLLEAIKSALFLHADSKLPTFIWSKMSPLKS